MLNDELYSKSGGNFPYKRYISGTSDNISRLSYLIKEYKPVYEPNGLIRSLIESKVRSRLPEHVINLFSNGPKNVSVNKESDWYYNSVIDQYTESARMVSPAYGKNYAPEDLWFKTSFSKIRDRIFKGISSLKDARELIYKENDGPRLAYVTESIGLYNYVKTELVKNKSPSVIDITAFGDRLVAAAATGYNYYGFDPDPNLTEGISRLLVDINSIKPDFNATVYTMPLEHFSCKHLVDFVSYSPPPYEAEPYSGGDRQTHKVYKDFYHWFYGFVREAIIRANAWLKEGGVLGFSVLDRDGSYKIFYTEAMILLTMKFGFKPLTIFSLSSGTVWWLFRKDRSYNNNLFVEYYSDYISCSKYHITSPAMEYLRFLATKYLVTTCVNSNLFENEKKAKKAIEDILMSKVHSFEDPDPLFPDDSSEVHINEKDFNGYSQIKFPIVIQTPDPGYRSVIYSDELDNPGKVFLQICNAIISYLHWVKCTYEYENFNKCIIISKVERYGKPLVNLSINRTNEISVISFLRKRTLFVKESFDNIKIFPKFIVLWSSSTAGITQANISSYLRYDSVGAIGHHFTRPESRIRALAEVANVRSINEIVDLFATPFNANSKLYGSLYPDVDHGSLGNFFSYDGGDYKLFMINPPPNKGTDEKLLERMVSVYLPGKTIFYSTVVWNDNGLKYLNSIRNNEDPKFNDIENYFILTNLWKYYKKYIKAVYILDFTLHPSYDAANDKKYTVKTRDNESVGVILTDNPDVRLSLDKINLLSNGAHVIFN